MECCVRDTPDAGSGTYVNVVVYDVIDGLLERSMVYRHGDVAVANSVASVESEGIVGDGKLLRTTPNFYFDSTFVVNERSGTSSRSDFKCEDFVMR